MRLSAPERARTTRSRRRGAHAAPASYKRRPRARRLNSPIRPRGIGPEGSEPSLLAGAAGSIFDRGGPVDTARRTVESPGYRGHHAGLDSEGGAPLNGASTNLT